jgi:hypothetical protein
VGRLESVTFRVLDAGTSGGVRAWMDLWRAWPGREVMAHPEYARLFARPQDRVVCVVGEDEGGWIFFPLLLRPLAAEPWARRDEARWDATSPYGFGGPFAWGRGPRDEEGFWRAFEAWCRDQRIVTTFASLSLFPEELASIPGTVEPRGPYVVRMLDAGLDVIWKQYDRNVRNNVRIAERSGLTVEVDRTGARLDAFERVYRHTMERRGASEWYRFPRSFFEHIVEKLAGHYTFFHVLSAGEVVSSELMLCSVDKMYSFLGGTLADAFKLRPNDLLRHRSTQWAIEEGKKAYVLGGAYEHGDGILRHKRNFSPRGEVPFWVACLQHDPVACRELAADRAEFVARQGKAWRPRPHYFPPYRA